MYGEIVSWWQYFPPELKIFFYAMIPIGELRSALPIAVKVYHLGPAVAWFWAVLGNTVMGALVILFLEPLLNFFLKKSVGLEKLWQKYIERIETKNRSLFEKWGAVALVTFVAIPLPMTGAFTGAVAASIFRIPFWKAVPLLGLGCAMAGGIVLGLTKAF